MLKKILFTSIAMFLSSAVYANGYWDYREVCDYETITTTTPWTHCSYNGHLYYSGGKSLFTSDFSVHYGHSSCAISKHTSKWNYEYNSQTQQWENNLYTGWLYLYNTNHTYSTSTTTQVVEGSCRMERVWIPLCRGCQIP